MFGVKQPDLALAIRFLSFRSNLSDNMSDEADIYVLAGVTAAGKTEASLAWAERGGVEILSCDSLLFYRGMDIGTAKPTPEELSRAPHHGIDLVPVSQTFDVGSYLAYAKRVVHEIIERGNRVLVVGGSGFYLQSFFASVIDEVEVPPDLRSQVMDWEEREGLKGLVGRLRELNPNGLGELDTENPRRVTRALERCLASGKDLLTLQQNFQTKDFPFRDFSKITWVLDRDDADLEERVRARTSSMWANGLLEEVEALREKGLGSNPSAARSVGYREALLHLDGKYTSAECQEAVFLATMRLARKQRKWFRSRLPADRTVLLPKTAITSKLEAPWEA